MKYMDRSGNLKEVASGQDKLLDWLYTHAAGRALVKLLVNPWVSVIGGRVLDSRLSKCAVKPFIRANHINMDDYVEKEYTSYNDFFTRSIKEERRPVAASAEALISPCDGKVTAYVLDDDSTFSVKNSVYTLSSLLCSKRLAKRFAGGYAVIVRLTVDDYHHYCYVDNARKTKNIFIPGRLHTVNPIAVETVPVYKENSREYTLLHTENFGDVIQLEVGALMVGRINNYHGRAAVKKGQEKGCFEFGGSTVILLLQRDRVHIDEDLINNTQNGCETIVRMGEKIGTKV